MIEPGGQSLRASLLLQVTGLGSQPWPLSCAGDGRKSSGLAPFPVPSTPPLGLCILQHSQIHVQLMKRSTLFLAMDAAT